MDDMIDALESALDFIAGYEDVVDGSYGEPQPNRAMIVAQQIRDALDQAK